MPLFLGILYSGAGFLVLSFLNAGNLTQGLMFCYMINTALIMVITRYWKISIHAAGVAAPIVALWVHGAHFPILMSGMMILVGLSRVILKAHSVSQVFAGHLLGLLLTWIQLHLFFL
jgi:membrane-associated phospholipid phosphatase